MGLKSKALTGARCKLYIEDADTGQYRLAGIFNSASYGVNYGVEPISIMGRYNVAEQVYTGMDVVSVELSGFRVVKNGPYEIGSVPKLQELINANDFHLALVDRQTGETVAKVGGCLVNNWHSSTASRSLTDLRVTMTGVTFEDESGPQEDVGSVDFG